MNGIAPEELSFIENTFEVKNPQTLFREDSRLIIENRKNLFSRIPAYLNEIKEFINGRDDLEFILECILKMAINFAAIDSNYSETETRLITEYYALLKKELLGAYYLSKVPIKDIKTAGEKFKQKEINKVEIQDVTPKSDNLIYSDNISDFDELIGLHNVKYELNVLINLIKVNKIRLSKGLPVININLHLIFSGNSGTGKTEISKCLAKIYKNLGILSKGNVIEASGDDLSEEEITKIINDSLGNILFIEKFTALFTDDKKESSKGILKELFKAMENNKNFIVIVSDNIDEMSKIMITNPDIKSHFNKDVLFLDYSPDDLLKILKLMLSKNKYTISDNLALKILDFLKTVNKNSFSNAHGVKKLFEKMVESQANRIVNLSAIENINLETLTEDDFNHAINSII